MSSALRPFVPDQAVRVLQDHPDEMPVAVTTRLHAVVLFTDISGFTAMSEALARVGRYGAEELGRILNLYFDQMIRRAVAYGGTVAHLAGDAMTVLFVCDDPPAPSVTRRAVHAALDMQVAMAGFEAVETSAGVFRLGMRAGVAAGPVLGTIVGDPAVRLEYVIAGPATDRAAAMEQLAATGQVVVDAALADDEVEGVDLDAGARLATRVRRPPPARPADPSAEVTGATAARLAPFLHPAIAERLQAGRRDLVNEHRPVTVAFVSFPQRTDEADDVTRMQAYVSAAVGVIDRYGGHLNQVDTGDKGNMLMLCFGTPVAHEDDEERAVRCCLELLGLPGGRFRAGVTTGLVFCGVIGSDHRRYYTVVGLTVNLAARLLQAAQPGQVLIDAPTFRRVQDSAVSERLEPVTVKGKRGPMSVWAVRAAREHRELRLLEPPVTGRLVGRDAELATIDAHARQARAGRGRVLTISGAAGIGKSRLVTETVAIAERLGFAVHGGACSFQGVAAAFGVWRPILRGLLGVDGDASVDDQREQLLDRMGALGPDWTERAPLLGPVLRISVPESGLTRPLDPQARADLLQSLAVSLVRRRSAQRPLLLVLEDCHWIDPSSMALLEAVARDITDVPVLIAVAARREVSTPSPVTSLEALQHHTGIELRDLTTEATEALAETRLRASYGDDADVPADVVATVAARAGGNPFHVEQLAAYLHARHVDLRDARQLAAVNVPNTLQRLVLARLDQLTEGEKATIKVASVIGRVFRPPWLWGSYPPLGGPHEVARHLSRLDTLDLTPLKAVDAEQEYAFKHAIIQEVAYDSLPFGLRETLHEAVGGFIERTYADSLDRYVDVLAHHYGRTRNHDKQRVWFRAAGTAAKASYANETAIGHFERLLPLLPEGHTGGVLLELGEVWHLVGRWQDAHGAYRRALQLADRADDRALAAAAKRQLGTLLMRTSSYADGSRWLAEAVHELERLDDRAGLMAALDRLAFAAIQQGAYASAAAAAERHLAIATEAGDDAGASGALHNLGLVTWDAGRRDEALDLMHRAMEAAVAAGDDRGQARIANDLAAIHVERGAHADTLEYLGRAVSIAQRIGDQWMVALCTGNASELYLLQGDLDRARLYAARALDIAVRHGDRVHVTFGIGRFAAIAAAGGELEEAVRLYDRGVALARSLDDSFTLHEYLHQCAKVLADMGRLGDAEQLNEEVRAATADADAHMWLQAELLSIRLRVALGGLDRSDATTQLEALAERSTETGERAAILATLVQVDPGASTARARAAALYRDCYEQAPTVESRTAYARLTGTQLPVGPALPVLLDAMEERTDVDVRALLEKVDAEVESMLHDDAARAR